MRNILTIALNDLRLLLRRSALISVFVPPIVLMLLIGFATGGNGGSTVYLIDVVRGKTDDTKATELFSALHDEGGQQFIFCDLAGQNNPKDCKLDDLQAGTDLIAYAKNRVTNSITVAAITIPADFGATITAGKTVAIGFINNGGQNGTLLIRQEIDSARTRLNGAIIAAQTISEKADPSLGDKTAIYDKAYTAAEKIWATNPVRVDEQSSPTAGSGVGGFGQSAPGMGAMFVLSYVLNIAVVFIDERRAGTLQRLFILPVTRIQVLAGKLAGRYLFGLVTFAVIIGVGSLFGIQWGDWSGVILTVLVYTLAVTAMGLAVSTFVKSAGQANGIRLILTLTLAPLGGAWWPLSIVPVWMQTLGKLSPIAWSQDAFTKMIFYGGHLVDILPSLGVLLIFAIVFFAIGIARFRYE